MVLFPNAKINLGLHVVAKRTDGYHTIETVFYPVKNLSDLLEILPAEKLSFTATGLSVDGAMEDNLCIKAYRCMAARFPLPPVQILLHKLIPMGAGLGGGSADAAFVLMALNRLFDLKLDNNQLKMMAAELGSDCSFFVDNCPSYATGRGELLEPISLDLSAWQLVLVKPSIHVSTAAAYVGIQVKQPLHDLKKVIALPPEKWKECLVNDFETTVFGRFPRIAQLKAELYAAGAVYAAMSGSGATVFGLFKEHHDVKTLFPDCFVQSTTL